MKVKHLVLGGAFVGVFALGAMFAPIGQPTANTNNQDVGKSLPLIQTATENDNEKVDTNTSEFICPMTGEPRDQAAGMGRGPGAGRGKNFAGTMHETITDELGMTPEELREARLDGQSVAELAEEKGVKLDKLVEKLVVARKAALEELVKDGKITQEQMNVMLENMETNMKTALEREATGPMMSRGGGKAGAGQAFKRGMCQNGGAGNGKAGMRGMGQGGNGNGGAGNQQFN